MKNNLLIITAILTFTIGLAQNSKTEEINVQKGILEKAKKIGDPTIAIQSFYALIVLEGENSTYKDSLAYEYFSTRKYGPCYIVSTEVLEREPKHIDMLKMKAISLESLGALEKAATVYQELLVLTNDNYHGYTVANLNYRMKKYDEAYVTIKKTEGMNDAGKYKVTYAINQNHTQKVELLAAIPYLKGLIEIELDKNAAAKISLAKALKIQSDFVLAKENLEALQKMDKKK